MICENCLYNKNCQFLLKHRNGEAEGCTVFEDKSEWVHLPLRSTPYMWRFYNQQHEARDQHHARATHPDICSLSRQ